MGGYGEALVQGNGRPSRSAGVSARGCAYGAGEGISQGEPSDFLDSNRASRHEQHWVTILSRIVGAATQLAWNLFLLVPVLLVVSLIMGRRPPV